MAFNDGDFVTIDYSAWRVGDGRLIYTTMKKLAEDNGILDKEANYVPQLVIMGKESVIKGVEKVVKTMNVSDSKTVEFEPKEAFGEKNPDLVKVLPLSDFKKRDMMPYPGMQLDIDNMVAVVKSVNSGRVVIDANHPLAGEKLKYEIKVVAKLDKEEDKVKAIAEAYSLKPDSVSVTGNQMKITFGEKIEKNSKYLVNKSDLVNSILRYMDKIEKVVVEEDYVKAKTEGK
ncbi:Putative FKBP-type peptidyl-prolyl cis-trans isomerase [uncultured archaeon]|nr:Putative FKBP-type peptidyl-prolyl cis-trans isomerase [uncultured archaeon]